MGRSKEEKAQVTFEPVAWSDRAAGDFSAMPGGDKNRIAGYAKGVAEGAYQLLAVMADRQRVGSLLFELVTEPVGPVVIIHALRCDAVPGVPVAEATTAIFASRCRDQGISLLRCFTERAGLVRKLCRAGAKAIWQVELAL